MNNFDKFIIETERLQCSPAENLELVIKYIAENKTITFFSWKMFDIVKPTFDPALADKYIEKEKEFIKILIKLKIKFIYIKLIPDELPRIFYGKGLNRQAIFQVYFVLGRVSVFHKLIYCGPRYRRDAQCY